MFSPTNSGLTGGQSLSLTSMDWETPTEKNTFCLLLVCYINAVLLTEVIFPEFKQDDQYFLLVRLYGLLYPIVEF